MRRRIIWPNERKVFPKKKVKGVRIENIKPQYDRYYLPGNKSIYMLAEGERSRPGCCARRPRRAQLRLTRRQPLHARRVCSPSEALVMSNSFTNQTLAQIDLWANKDKYEKTVYRLSKKLDEEVARLHLEKIGGVLTKLTKAQADYLNVPVEGPYKPEHYRY